MRRACLDYVSKFHIGKEFWEQVLSVEMSARFLRGRGFTSAYFLCLLADRESFRGGLLQGPRWSSASKGPAHVPMFRSSRSNASTAPCASRSSQNSVKPANSPRPAHWLRSSPREPSSPIRCSSSMRSTKTPTGRCRFRQTAWCRRGSGWNLKVA